MTTTPYPTRNARRRLKRRARGATSGGGATDSFRSPSFILVFDSPRAAENTHKEEEEEQRNCSAQFTQMALSSPIFIPMGGGGGARTMICSARPLLRGVVVPAGAGGRRGRLGAIQVRVAAPAGDRKARKASKQAANAKAVNKRLKADDSYFWRLKSEGFSREKPNKPSEVELFGDKTQTSSSSSSSSSFEIESETKVTRAGDVGKDVAPIDEFGDDFLVVVSQAQKQGSS